MRRLIQPRLCALACTYGLLAAWPLCAVARGKPQAASTVTSAIAVDTTDLPALPYDAGRVKFIASSADTGGATAVLELIEFPGYKTAWHRHDNCEESFYVLEGTLTIQLADKTYALPAGSYVFIPRGTPHAQGNFTPEPVRLLTTFTPGGFEHFFSDRVELFKSVKPGDPAFPFRFAELRAKHAHWVHILGRWDYEPAPEPAQPTAYLGQPTPEATPVTCASGVVHPEQRDCSPWGPRG